jgi:perosamine synthetase
VQKPALEGGKPQRERYLPYGQHKLTSNDIDAAIRVLKSKWITQGPIVDEFENAFATRIGCRHAIAVNSGTAALHAAVASLNLSPGDEVITTPLTFIATINAILYVGAKPTFADINPETLNIDPKDAASRITEKTKAMIFVHFAGNPSGFGDAVELSHNHQLSLIDDASHALGAKCKGRMIGSTNESISTFSFHPVKHITTGEGGMVTTGDAEKAEFIKTFRNHGITSQARERYGANAPWHYDATLLGWNYRLNGVGCALGMSQLQRLSGLLAKRTKIARFYDREFKDLAQIQLQSIETDCQHAWHLYPVILRLEELTVDRDKFLSALRAENIGATVHYSPAHLFSFHRSRLGYKEGDFPIAESVSNRIVSLPNFPSMSQADCNDVVQAVKKLLTYYSK